MSLSTETSAGILLTLACFLQPVFVNTYPPNSPLVIVLSSFTTQAFADPSRAAAARSQKVLEINPRCVCVHVHV